MCSDGGCNLGTVPTPANYELSLTIAIDQDEVFGSTTSIIHLTGKDEVVVGRNTVCEVTLPDPQVARRHARLVRTGEGWRVVDLGSKVPKELLLKGNWFATVNEQ